MSAKSIRIRKSKGRGQFQLYCALNMLQAFQLYKMYVLKPENNR